MHQRVLRTLMPARSATQGHVVGRYIAVVLNSEPRLQQMQGRNGPAAQRCAACRVVGLKSDLKKLRRVFVYHQQVFAALRLERYPGLGEDRQHRLNDLFEHKERAGSLTQLYYELASALIDGYISLACTPSQ